MQEWLATTGAEIAIKVLGAFAFWVIGRWLIAVAVRMLQSGLQRQRVDPTLLRYAGSILPVTLNIILVVGILEYFGVQTTSFAALFAAAGVAVGMAWSGLLAHFAAGAFLIVLRHEARRDVLRREPHAEAGARGLPGAGAFSERERQGGGLTRPTATRHIPTERATDRAVSGSARATASVESFGASSDACFMAVM